MMSNVYIVRFAVEVTADSRDEAEAKATALLQEYPEVADLVDSERLWVLE